MTTVTPKSRTDQSSPTLSPLGMRIIDYIHTYITTHTVLPTGQHIAETLGCSSHTAGKYLHQFTQPGAIFADTPRGESSRRATEKTRSTLAKRAHEFITTYVHTHHVLPLGRHIADEIGCSEMTAHNYLRRLTAPGQPFEHTPRQQHSQPHTGHLHTDLYQKAHTFVHTFYTTHGVLPTSTQLAQEIQCCQSHAYSLLTRLSQPGQPFATCTVDHRSASNRRTYQKHLHSMIDAYVSNYVATHQVLPTGSQIATNVGCSRNTGVRALRAYCDPGGKFAHIPRTPSASHSTPQQRHHLYETLHDSISTYYTTHGRTPTAGDLMRTLGCSRHMATQALASFHPPTTTHPLLPPHHQSQNIQHR